MQFYSFDLHDPIFLTDGWRLSFQIITLETVYGPRPEYPSLTTNTQASQESNGQLRLTMTAQAPHKIRAVKILLRGLPNLRPLDMLDNPQETPAKGRVDRYPNQLRTPVYMAAQPDNTTIGLRCEDPQTRAKRFAVYREPFGECAGDYTLEAIHEEDARWFDTQITVPDWILERQVEPAAFRDAQLAFS